MKRRIPRWKKEREYDDDDGQERLDPLGTFFLLFYSSSIPPTTTTITIKQRANEPNQRPTSPRTHQLHYLLTLPSSPIKLAMVPLLFHSISHSFPLSPSRIPSLENFLSLLIRDDEEKKERE